MRDENDNKMKQKVRVRVVDREIREVGFIDELMRLSENL